SCEMALLRITQLARTPDGLTPAQAAEAVARSADFLDSGSERHSNHAGVRIQAVLTLEALGMNDSILRSLPTDLRERAFSTLAMLPIQRTSIEQHIGALTTEFGGPLVEPNGDVRVLSERVAGLYSKSHVPGHDPSADEP